METMSKRKLIRIGFWLGIGFIVPQLFIMFSGTAISMLAMPSIMEASFDSKNNDVVSNFTSNFDLKDQIKIQDYREKRNGNQLLILGTIVNSGDKKASSIQLEAELKDKDGNFVYECTEYINKDLKPSDIENFQIKCGCGKNAIPEYSTINVRVVSANNY